MYNPKLSLYSKFVCLCTWILIFAGSLVTSTGSGLSVPDWPLSYGTLFPPMVGGIVYEHSHRVIAGFIAIFTFILAGWMGFKEKRKWVRNLGFFAVGAVLVQATLGGVTVLFYLPTAISVSHALLAQTFFLIIIAITYAQSKEFFKRQQETEMAHPALFKSALLLLICIYIQLFLGALMRHTGSGLAIYDFPKMAGEWFPAMDQAMLRRINDWRFEHSLRDVTKIQVLFHLLHRIGAAAVAIAVVICNIKLFKTKQLSATLRQTLLLINGVVLAQMILGIATVLSVKAPWTTSFHVATGAFLLGASLLFVLRCCPIKLEK